MSEGAVCHPFLVGSGARGIELAYEDGRMQVRIMTCSSRADHELALAVVKYLARKGPHVLVTPEDADEMSYADVAKRYGDGWIAEQVEVGTRYPLSLAAEGQTITLGGSRRDFHLGPRLHAELVKAGNPGVRLLDA